MSMVSLKDHRCGASAAVADMQRARRFYEGVLGLVPGTDTGDNVGYPCGGDTQINVYLSPNAGTAKFTIAGFDVDDIEAVVTELTRRVKPKEKPPRQWSSSPAAATAGSSTFMASRST
jgi:catechol 2,3-dioxygenase-like lactoylglutathione lyase family enzyme